MNIRYNISATTLYTPFYFNGQNIHRVQIDIASYKRNVYKNGKTHEVYQYNGM